MKQQQLPEKTCATCGRPFTWRKSLAKNWEQVTSTDSLERYSAGLYYRECPLRNECPFDASYETLTARLFPRMSAPPQSREQRR